MQTLAQIQKRIQGGESRRSIVEECLARIADSNGEGSRVFLKVSAEAARAASDSYDRCGEGAPFAGIPVSIKDLFDIAGEVTTAGSVVLRDAKPAAGKSVV